MSNILPEVNFFSGFYIWFNKETKKEYYSTPLYYYKADFHMDMENHLLEVYYKESVGTDNGLKHPASLYFPFHEKFGLLLLRFLNANLSNYETAYKTFFYAYGFEILKDLSDGYISELSNNYGSDEEYLKATNRIFEDLKENLINLQYELKEAVTYIYNLDNNKLFEKYTYSERFAVYLIKRKGELYTYNKNDNIIRDSYSNKYLEFMGDSEEKLLNSLKDNSMFVSMIDTHQSNDLSSICYAVLEELVKTANYPIKKCQNCGMYFIPSSRLDEIYCDYPKANGKTCRAQGAVQAYNERLKQNKALAEYRRLYQLKSMAVGRNKDNKQMKKDFDKWKKDAKDRVNKLKHGVLTEDEVYEWLVNNK